MDIIKIRELIDLMQEKNVGEIELKEDKSSVRISQFSSVNNYQTSTQQLTAPIFQENAMKTANSPNAENTASGNQHSICSPMVGTFYASPSPDAEPFIKVGQKVESGDVLCIVEAMKMFNQIEADCSGKISVCLVENGQPVEYGQPLFVIE
jgi:acetyl-CoA carboxylase biotin carboxyl carrier protein